MGHRDQAREGRRRGPTAASGDQGPTSRAATGVPEHIRSDNGSAFIAKALRRWLECFGLGTVFSEPGSPWETGYIESSLGIVDTSWSRFPNSWAVHETQQSTPVSSSSCMRTRSSSVGWASIENVTSRSA